MQGLALWLSVPVLVLLEPPFLAGLARDLRRRRFSLDGLIGIGAAAAFLYSGWSLAAGGEAVYFDTATMLLVLVTAGRLLEANARLEGKRALDGLMRSQPVEARVWREQAWRTVEASSVTAGERVQACAGERIPVDGAVQHGVAAVDQSVLTGESLPLERGPGSQVRAGSLCLDGTLEITAAAPAADSLLQRMIRAVEELRATPSRRERLADRAVAVFVPLTLLLAAAVTAYWSRRDPARAWLNGLSVLVVACPCALGIATPVVNVRALAAAARRGILIRSPEALERLAEVHTVALDKTGTVTCGQMEVTRVVADNQAQLLAHAASAAAGSLHPVALAVARAAEAAGVAPAPRQSARTLPGRGVEARLLDGSPVWLGQPRWVASRAGLSHQPAPDEGPGGVAWCATEGRLLGAFFFQDPVSQEALDAVAACRQLGLRLALLSGDRAPAVSEAARRLGVIEWAAELLPEEKVERIRASQAKGQLVAMVGDGINDALPLAAADVGIAVSSGTEVAREVAAVAFLEGDLRKLPQLVELARRARRVARQNLAWTFAYNSVGLALAAAGLLRPVWAALLMLVSSAVVIGNSMRVGRQDGAGQA
jgi:heavy metal translocating P-type ATPase